MTSGTLMTDAEGNSSSAACSYRAVPSSASAMAPAMPGIAGSASRAGANGSPPTDRPVTRASVLASARRDRVPRRPQTLRPAPRLERHRPERRRARGGGDHRPIGLREEHAHPDDQRARGDRERDARGQRDRGACRARRREPPAQGRRHGLPVVQPFPHLTAIENVMLAPLKVRKLGRSEARDRAMRLLEKVGIPEKADAPPPRLSGGQQQRVAIARALAMEPRIMLFDEPTSAPDPEMIREVLDVMRDLAREGMTMLVVTHEVGFAREASNRVVFMDGGRIIEDSPTQEFFAAPREERAKQFLSKVIRH